MEPPSIIDRTELITAESLAAVEPVLPHTVWPEVMTGIKFDKITSKLHFKNMTDLNLTK